VLGLDGRRGRPDNSDLDRLRVLLVNARDHGGSSLAPYVYIHTGREPYSRRWYRYISVVQILTQSSSLYNRQRASPTHPGVWNLAVQRQKQCPSYEGPTGSTGTEPAGTKQGAPRIRHARIRDRLHRTDLYGTLAQTRPSTGGPCAEPELSQALGD